MGLRFRKSIKIAPGVKLNLNKKSTSITFGKKGFHHTISSTGKKASTIGIPGTGLSYSTTNNKNKSHSSSAAAQNSANSKTNGGCLSTCLILFIGLVLLALLIGYAWIPGIIATIYFAIKTTDKKEKFKRISISALITLFSFLFLYLQLQKLRQQHSTYNGIKWTTI